MAELITFPDIEAVVVSYLSSTLAGYESFEGVHVGTKTPQTRPARFVRVEVVGGTSRDLIYDVPSVVVEAWANSAVDAAALAGMCRALMLAAGRDGWMGSTPCTDVDLISRPQSLPDPVSDQARYTATYAVQVRGSGA